eukprot:UN25273
MLSKIFQDNLQIICHILYFLRKYFGPKTNETRAKSTTPKENRRFFFGGDRGIINRIYSGCSITLPPAIPAFQ